MPASDAEGACEKVNEQDLDGRTIRVNEAQPKGMSAPRGAPPVAEEAEVDLEVHEAMIEEEAVVVDMDTKVNWMDTVLDNGCNPWHNHILAPLADSYPVDSFDHSCKSHPTP